jgi:nucleoside 2-deoxyribosyltransferase
MNVLVVGGFDDQDQDHAPRIREFCTAFGKALVVNGHVLLSGCQTEFDALIAKSAQDELVALGAPDPEKRIINYVLAGSEPSHRHGTVLRSQLTDWEIATESFYVPEQVREADVVFFVGGYQGTYRAANWARIAKKPLLPVTAFNGAAAKIYEQELSEFDKKYAGLVERLEYEELNSLTGSWDKHTSSLIELAEKVAESRSVVAVMSYADRADLDDLYDSLQQVCNDLRYICVRVTQENTEDRILSEILKSIDRSAFVIVDLTDLRPNVLYEFGYATGLKKRIIVTAKEGTELPFDVKDVPTIFWDGQKKLREDLKAKIGKIVKAGVGSAATPLG